jgi:isopropylmalate/homocitrate/citramalate synthase
VYSGVPADIVGREQVITVGPMSGQANVLAWLLQHDLVADAETVDRILEAAKTSECVLKDDEILELVGSPTDG